MTSQPQAFEWLHFLEVALNLRQQVATSAHAEAVRRSLVGRAYYAAYWTAFEYGKANNLQIPEYGTQHDRVISCFVNSPNKALNTVGNRLKSLKKLRHDADYEKRAFVPKYADEALVYARRIIQALQGPET